MMKTDEIRKNYLDYFASKDHRLFPSDSLIPVQDPSLLFTGAGMNQFKLYFLGQKKDVRRATSCQKCLRTADLDRVGKTEYHHTFFEMLGNFSFGDYFKREAIAWGWEYVTRVLGLPKARLWVSVYEEDEEAFGIWRDAIGVEPGRIVRMGPVDNFWPSNAKMDGPNGPCGPCSEIYVGNQPGRGVEIWNLVFTQFDRQADGTLKELPQKNIDTGMGLERVAAVMQGVQSNFDTDNFVRIRKELRTYLKPDSREITRENAVMDHCRAVIFSVADGANPSNEGRGYVIRKLIRLGCDHIQKAGALDRGLFNRLVPVVVEVMKTAYPELLTRQKEIQAVIENEERSYNNILKTVVPMFKQELRQIRQEDPLNKDGQVETAAFKYRDTYGVAYETICECVAESGLKMEEGRFNEYMERQKRRSREATKIAGSIFSKDEMLPLVESVEPTKFLGYDAIIVMAELLKIIHEGKNVAGLSVTQEGFLIFDQTVFYAEQGGQIGDQGMIFGEGFEAEVVDAQLSEKRILHRVRIKRGVASPGQNYELRVDAVRRDDIMRNHTATHLLHSALRKVLGGHVKQAGSYVGPEYLRFDFAHFNAVTPQELLRVESLVNEAIRKNTPVDKTVMTKADAIRQGATAFFGEKYADEVRVISIGDISKELCGGTHLDFTGVIGSFKITAESSVQAGIRRIEAVTGRGAAALLRSFDGEIMALMKAFDVAEESILPKALKDRYGAVKGLKNQLTQRVEMKIRQLALESMQKAPLLKGARFVHLVVRGADVELLKGAFDALRDVREGFVGVFESCVAGKISYVVCAADALIQRGFKAQEVIAAINRDVGGQGGGRPEFAVGASKDVSQADRVLAAALQAVEKQLMKAQ